MSRHRLRLLVGAVVAVAFAVWAKVRIDALDPETQATNPIIRWEYLFSRPETREELWERTVEHLQLTVVPVLLGLVIASGLAALALRYRWALPPITVLTSFLYTIPSLALFGLLATVVGNWAAAVIALTSYTLLILVSNIVAGIDGVPAAVLDAADGVGMGRLRRRLTVELPLALPVILTGVRVATVTTVGLVGITSVIQLGGLGALIFDGFGRDYTTLMVLGAGLMVLLAVSLDLALALLERALTPWSRRVAAR